MHEIGRAELREVREGIARLFRRSTFGNVDLRSGGDHGLRRASRRGDIRNSEVRRQMCAERLRRALVALAQRLGDESPLLSDLRLEPDALAAWLAMSQTDAAAAATLLQAQGLVTLRDGVLRSVRLQADAARQR